MKKGTMSALKVLIILGVLIALISIFTIYSQTIYVPKSGNSALDSIVNKYYFPVNTKSINTDSCTNSNVEYGSYFSFSSSNLPSTTSRNCMIIAGQAYTPINAVDKNIKGSCASEGNILKFGKSPVFSKLSLVSKRNSYILCKDNTRSNTHDNLMFEKANICQVKYTQTNSEPEGKYYCDGTKIYRTPCNKKSKVLIETCSLGCEYSTQSIDGNDVEVAKCIGDYKPNYKLCSNTGLAYYETDNSGNLRKSYCCGCTNNKCIKCSSNLSNANCKLIGGSGKNQINIIMYNDIDEQDLGFWIIKNLEETTPYNEFTYNLYREVPKYGCKNYLKTKMRDTRIGIEPIKGDYAGWGEPGTKYEIGNMMISPKVKNPKWYFLLFHELGHIYTHASHSNDGSIMDKNGGDSKYRDYQVQKIRNNLNFTAY